ncbi:DNA cytosine methyltransferase [Tengunoibacter tsumagoiensis]|uniref:DNA (cytosine-5-)-methyltransferase n=1 Tax=Tengunoibacter tsumagoiensis TaxID=2014871 RepID=A0A402A027_9CHLR|nr:DNA cytosine methyltransferase [Tengunoibacter tsumagoiensis]GCE12500.1 cytosine-specific methyltransferase [Tengunoibacter tsumagoiensis]
MDAHVPKFIDVFAGAGGLSLGLMMAGWKGLFAVEKSPMAFETLKYNLIDQKDNFTFEWPDWLPKEATDIEILLDEYKSQLKNLPEIQLLAGGPPCQGFSNSGRRKYDDQRNRLFEKYLELVKLLRPQMLLVENVQGFAKTFKKTEKGKNGKDIEEQRFNADEELQEALLKLGYTSFREKSIKAKDFGVPQIRPRYILIAIRNDIMQNNLFLQPFDTLFTTRATFLPQHNLPLDQEITLEEAISDLEKVHGHVQCIEPRMKRFKQGLYGPIQPNNFYQKLMRQHRNGTLIQEGCIADSHRFANHSQEIEHRFNRIIHEFTPGKQLKEQERKLLNLNKHRIAPLSRNEACHTLTSLPDDLVHYGEPRIPTVREYARIQSFPDWFEFKAKYTTGDTNRRTQIPRYTQVANAVPPLLAEAIGTALKIVLANAKQRVTGNTDTTSAVDSTVNDSTDCSFRKEKNLVSGNDIKLQKRRLVIS